MKKKGYKLIDHTADVGLVACGESLAQAYANAAAGMFSIMVDLAEVNEADTRRVEITGDDPEGLLFEWLNYLVYLFEVESLIFRRFAIIEFGNTRLVADCYGEKYDPARHTLKAGVKSATYHMLEVDRESKQVQVIFDI